MYIGIFAGIIFGFILPNSGKTEDEYKSMKCKFAWFDYDHTEESEELFSYLDHAHKHAELKQIRRKRCRTVCLTGIQTVSSALKRLCGSSG